MNLVERGPYRVRGLRLVGMRAGEFERHDVLGIEAGIEGPELKQSANHQSRTDKEHQGHCHLTDHKDCLRAAPGAGDSPSAFIQGPAQTASCSLPRRGQAKDDARENGYCQRKQKDTRIEANIF